MISYGVLSLVGEVMEQASSTLMEVEMTSEEAEVKVDARITAESAVMSIILAIGIKIAKWVQKLLLSDSLAFNFNIDLCMTFGI